MSPSNHDHNPPSPTSLAPGLEDDAGARARILEVATRLFAQQGFAATSVREITQAAGVTNPTLYYHFKSKAGLFQAILTESIAAVEHQIEDVMEGRQDFHAALVEIVRLYYSAACQNPDLCRMFIGFSLGVADHPLEFDREAFQQVRRARFDAFIERGRALGALRDDVPNAVIHRLLGGMILIPILDFLEGHAPCLEQRDAEHMVDVFLRGAGRCGSPDKP